MISGIATFMVVSLRKTTKTAASSSTIATRLRRAIAGSSSAPVGGVSTA